MTSRFEELLSQLPRHPRTPRRIVAELSEKMKCWSFNLEEPKEPKSATLGKLKRIEDAIKALGPTARWALDESAPERGQDIGIGYEDFREITYDALAMSLKSEGLPNADRRKLERLNEAFETRGVRAGVMLDHAYTAQWQWTDETRAPFSVRLIGTVWLAIAWQKESTRPGRPKGSAFPSSLADRLARAYLSITREHPPTTDPYAATREHPYHHLVREAFKHAGVLPGWQHHARAAARRIRGEKLPWQRPN